MVKETPREDAAPALRARHLLTLLPTVGMLAGIPWANRVEPYVLGLPFLLAWIVAWVLAISATLAVVHRLDEAAARRAGDGG